MEGSGLPGLLVVGESLVDVLATSGGRRTRAPGGSPLNVAVTAGRLGTPVALRTVLGEDGDGEILRRHLAESGVRIHSGPRIARTSTAIAHLGTGGQVSYDVDLEWPALGAITAEAGAVHTGSLAFFTSPGAADVHAVLRRAHDAGRLTSLDPNIRPGLVGGRREAVRRIAAALPELDVVKLSEEDAQWLYPDLDRDQMLGRLRSRGPALTVLTLGEQGAVLATDRSAVTVPAAAARFVDPVGAGDAFMGGLLHALLDRGASREGIESADVDLLGEVGAFAARVAALTVAQPGANPPWRNALRTPASSR